MKITKSQLRKLILESIITEGVVPVLDLVPLEGWLSDLESGIPVANYMVLSNYWNFTGTRSEGTPNDVIVVAGINPKISERTKLKEEGIKSGPLPDDIESIKRIAMAYDADNKASSGKLHSAVLKDVGMPLFKE